MDCQLADRGGDGEPPGGVESVPQDGERFDRTADVGSHRLPATPVPPSNPVDPGFRIVQVAPDDQISPEPCQARRASSQ